jgi:hypothetical protein
VTTSSDKPTTRKTSAYVRDKGLRPLIVTIQHGLLTLRPQGLRSSETVDLSAVYQGAVKARVFSERMAKAKARKERKVGRGKR